MKPAVALMLTLATTGCPVAVGDVACSPSEPDCETFNDDTDDTDTDDTDTEQG